MTARLLTPWTRSTDPHPTRRTRHRGRPPSVAVRDLRDGELDVLDAVFAGLSPQSRWLRFHAGTPRMTPEVRHALAAVDGHRHIAVAAHAPDGRPVGIARLVRLDDRSADLGIEVVDAWQGRGIGRRLLLAVARRGRTAGYTSLVAEVLAENTAMSALLASTLPLTSRVTTRFETTLTADLRPSRRPTTAGRPLTA